MIVNDRAQPARGVGENQSSNKIDDQGAHLYDEETCRRRIEGQRSRRRQWQPGIVRSAQRQQLNQTEADHPQQRPLQGITTELDRTQHQAVNTPEANEARSAQGKRGQCPVVDCAVGERGQHHRDADR